jgi:hypothetical protein
MSIHFDKGALRLEFGNKSKSVQRRKVILSSKWSTETIDYESLTHSGKWKPLLTKIVNFDKVMVDKKHQAKMRRFTYLDANQFRIDYGNNIVRRFSEVSVFENFYDEEKSRVQIPTNGN